MLGKWDDAVDAMRKKDKALETAQERLENRGTMLRQKQADLDSQAKFFKIEVANNSELDLSIDELDREVVGMTPTRTRVFHCSCCNR